MPPGPDILRRIREARDKIRTLDAERADLVEGRNRVIRQALAQGRSERQVAEAAGLHHSSIGKIRRAPTE